MQSVGPILYFRGVRDRSWALSALVAESDGDEPHPLLAGGAQFLPQALDRRSGRTLWRYDFTLPYGDEPGLHEYRIGGRRWDVPVPAAGGPLRLAFTACNGSEMGNAWKKPEQRNPLWRNLVEKNAESSFHLLLQGGDQLYADPVWKKVPELGAWKRLPASKRFSAPFTPEMAQDVRDYYFDEYCRVWSQEDLAPVLADTPSLMMWDDHDIIDGWGSYPQIWHDCEVMQGVWSAAREHFALFQLAARPDDLPEGFSDRRGGQFGWAYRIGDIGILAPDLRSERSRARILGEAGRRALSDALQSMNGCRHVLLIFTVPLVNAHLHALEGLFRRIPGHQSWEDDLVDQWPSLAHWEEWSSVLRELVSFSAESGATLTSLSGEIHLGALGLIESPAAQIYQITSSGIVHPPPPALLTAALEWSSRHDMQVEPDITVKALPIPGLSRRYLRARNWLALDVSAVEGLTATWHSEDGEARRFAIR